MFISMIILILLLPIVILPLALKTSFSSKELKEMGICLENPLVVPAEEHICKYKRIASKIQVVCGNS